jgi:hypothetical protein
VPALVKQRRSTGDVHVARRQTRQGALLSQLTSYREHGSLDVLLLGAYELVDVSTLSCALVRSHSGSSLLALPAHWDATSASTRTFNKTLKILDHIKIIARASVRGSDAHEWPLAAHCGTCSVLASVTAGVARPLTGAQRTFSPADVT